MVMPKEAKKVTRLDRDEFPLNFLYKWLPNAEERLEDFYSAPGRESFSAYFKLSLITKRFLPEAMLACSVALGEALSSGVAVDLIGHLGFEGLVSRHDGMLLDKSLDIQVDLSAGGSVSWGVPLLYETCPACEGRGQAAISGDALGAVSVCPRCFGSRYTPKLDSLDDVSYAFVESSLNE